MLAIDAEPRVGKATRFEQGAQPPVVGVLERRAGDEDRIHPAGGAADGVPDRRVVSPAVVLLVAEGKPDRERPDDRAGAAVLDPPCAGVSIVTSVPRRLA